MLFDTNLGLAAPAMPPRKPLPTFVEGTQSAFATLLYEVHMKYPLSPGQAVLATATMFAGANERAIVHDACVQVEKLMEDKQASKRKTQQATELSVEGHAQLMKTARIKQAREEMNAAHKEKNKDKEETARAKALQLQEEIDQLIYSQTEIDEATKRSQRSAALKAPGGADENKKKMKNIWTQMVRALLLEMLRARENISPDPVTYENSTALPLKTLSNFSKRQRGECGRAVLQAGENIRSFATRLQELQLYCMWLHNLQVNESLGENKNKKKAQEINDELDESLFQLLANALPDSLLFLRVSAESTVADGKRFTKLKTSIDSLASASREQPTSSPASASQEALHTNLDLHKIGSGRLSRDPDSKTNQEEVTETLKKKSKILYKKHKQNKKQQEDRGEASDDDGEEEVAEAMALSAAETRVPGSINLVELCDTILAMTAAKTAGVCYNFKNRGKCENASCPYVHEARKQRSRSPSKRRRSPDKRSPQRGLKRSDHKDDRRDIGSNRLQKASHTPKSE